MRLAGFFTPPPLWRKVIAALFLGVLLGSVGTAFFIGSRMEELEMERERLLGELEKEHRQVEQLTKSLKERRRRVVTHLTIDLAVKNPYCEPVLKKYITALLADLVGMEVSRVEPKLIWKILHGREVKIKNELYYLHVRWVLIGEEVQVGVKAEVSGDTYSE